MSVRQADRLSRELIDRGMPGESHVDICVDVSKETERHVAATVDTLAQVIRRDRITGCAILLVTWAESEDANARSIRMPECAHGTVVQDMLVT
jgi:uroporphyrin-III C-methyltransferase/precorrin-2 dehydrogenase/sirohydrochlorin ferrochelatase